MRVLRTGAHRGNESDGRICTAAMFANQTLQKHRSSIEYPTGAPHYSIGSHTPCFRTGTKQPARTRARAHARTPHTSTILSYLVWLCHIRHTRQPPFPISILVRLVRSPRAVLSACRRAKQRERHCPWTLRVIEVGITSRTGRGELWLGNGAQRSAHGSHLPHTPVPRLCYRPCHARACHRGHVAGPPCPLLTGRACDAFPVCVSCTAGGHSSNCLSWAMSCSASATSLAEGQGSTAPPRIAPQLRRATTPTFGSR